MPFDFGTGSMSGLPDDYMARLRNAATKFDPTTITPVPTTQRFVGNQNFDVQNIARQGGLVIPKQDTLWQPLNERENQINKTSQIATDQAYTDQAGRQKQYADQMAEFYRNQPGWNAPSVSWDNNNGGDTFGLAGGGDGDDPMDNARKIIAIGKYKGIDETGIKIALMTALTESGLRNINGGDRDSLGLFQQRPSQGWGTPEQIMDPSYAAGKFYSQYQPNYGMTPWAIAQSIQRSAFPDGSNYQRYWGQANSLYDQLKDQPYAIDVDSGRAYNPNAQRSDPGVANWINAYNNRYLDYDHAYGAQCVDLYAYYTSGFVGGSPNPVGYAPEIYNNFDSNVYHRLGWNAPAQMGDVAVWGNGPYTPYGHVAIVVGDNGNGTLRVLQSNARGLAADDPRNTSVISNISKAALMGYLRPNRLG